MREQLCARQSRQSSVAITRETRGQKGQFTQFRAQGRLAKEETLLSGGADQQRKLTCWEMHSTSMVGLESTSPLCPNVPSLQRAPYKHPFPLYPDFLFSIITITKHSLL